MISVLVPTFGRPGRLADVTANILGATRAECEVVLIAEADDPESVAAAEAIPDAVLVVNSRAHSWSGAINDGFAHMRGDLYFTGSDDLNFHDGWDVPALAVLASDPGLRVCGTNDLAHPASWISEWSTSHLVDRRYIDETGGVIDQPPGICQNEAYDHNYTDTEFVATAKYRGVFAPCLASIVEHMHFTVGKSPLDATYELSGRHFDDDRKIYESRWHLWDGAS